MSFLNRCLAATSVFGERLRNFAIQQNTGVVAYDDWKAIETEIDRVQRVG